MEALSIYTMKGLKMDAKHYEGPNNSKSQKLNKLGIGPKVLAGISGGGTRMTSLQMLHFIKCNSAT